MDGRQENDRFDSRDDHDAPRAGTAIGARPGAWAGYAASLWALLFAALSFYWAIGGRLGAGTIGAAVEGPALAREPAFVALLWATALLKLMAALLAVALVRDLPRRMPRWVLLLAGWGTATLLLLYGLANLAEHLLIVTGVIAVPAGLGEAALPWHLLLWDPVWIVGGVLFTLAALRYARLNARPRLTRSAKNTAGRPGPADGPAAHSR